MISGVAPELFSNHRPPSNRYWEKINRQTLVRKHAQHHHGQHDHGCEHGVLRLTWVNHMVNLLFSWVYLGDGAADAAGAAVGAGVGDFNLVTVPSRNVPKIRPTMWC